MFLKQKFKLFTLCPVLVALVGCGKKMADAKVTAQGQVTGDAASQITLEAAIDSGARQDDSYTVPRSGDIHIPAAISASAGTAAGYSLRVYVNRLVNDWEFYCIYKGVTTASYNRYALDKCYDMDGLDLGLSASNIDLYTFPVDAGKTVQMTMVSGPARARNAAKATFSIDWK